MDSSDRLALAVLLVDIAVIVLAGLAGVLIDLARPGRRWTRRRQSARSLAMLGTCVLGVTGMAVLAFIALLDPVRGAMLSPLGLGPCLLGIAAAILYQLSRRQDAKRA